MQCSCESFWDFRDFAIFYQFNLTESIKFHKHASIQLPASKKWFFPAFSRSIPAECRDPPPSQLRFGRASLILSKIFLTSSPTYSLLSNFPRLIVKIMPTVLELIPDRFVAVAVVPSN